MQDITISTDTIQLDQFLKWANVVGSGGQAKGLIKEQLVKVNGELELRIRRKLNIGDHVEIEGIGHFKVVREE